MYIHINLYLSPTQTYICCLLDVVVFTMRTAQQTKPLRSDSPMHAVSRRARLLRICVLVPWLWVTPHTPFLHLPWAVASPTVGMSLTWDGDPEPHLGSMAPKIQALPMTAIISRRFWAYAFWPCTVAQLLWAVRISVCCVDGTAVNQSTSCCAQLCTAAQQRGNG